MKPAEHSQVQPLRQIVEELRGEFGAIQVLGRALSPEEQHRAEALRKAIEGVEQAIEALLGIYEPA